MTDDARNDTAETAYRGFLFSDMRGFTAFAERHGNAAAAAAVGRFLDIARAAIARHDGAELKTEGDAIHAVFPSASSAVLCGLDIVDAAAVLKEREPDQPLDLGVGVHAGEAVETAEGYIGSAVNLAARLCAIARPGEVLVTSTVKSTAQSSIPVGFVPRGRQRLKGIRDPVEVYAVTRDLTARTAVVMPRLGLALAASGLGAVALLAAAVLGASVLPGGGAANPSQPGAATPQPLVMGPLLVGRYTSAAFRPSFTFDIDDAGWTASRDGPRLFALLRDAPPRGSVDLLRVQEVIEQPCVQGGETTPRPEPADVIAELEALDHADVANERVTQVGGWAGRQVDVTISPGALAACGGLVGQEVAVFVAGGETWGASSGETFRLLSVSSADEHVTILVGLDWSVSRSVQEQEELYALASRFLAGVEF